MNLPESFQELGISLGLGLIVGLQRERSESRLGGVRTFPLVTLLGTLCGQLAGVFGGWMVGAALLALTGMIVVRNLVKMHPEPEDPGLTTEIAMLLMFCVGACLAAGNSAVGVALGAGVAVLLHLKAEMHRLAARIGDSDFQAIMQFVLITLVILPVLPNQSFGPYAVFNPHKVWLMVVLIVGISLAGYVAYKLFGQRAGALIGGILGGLISSTATTVSYARRVAGAPDSASLSALVIAIASAVVFFRVMVIIGIVAPGTVAVRMCIPIGMLFLGLSVCVAIMFFARRAGSAEMPARSDRSARRPAMAFAIIFTVVLLAVAAAVENFGSGALYGVAVLSGLTDMDAITLSTLQMLDGQRVEPDTAWRVILCGAMSNVVFKAVMALALGGPALFRRLCLFFGVSLGGGLAIVFLYPTP